MHKLFGGAAALALVAFASTPALADRDTRSYTSLTVFGDSLVDAGNIFLLTGGATPSPAAGYFAGRFTNGFDYTDLLSQALALGPTVASSAGGNNFAYGGARVVANSAAAFGTTRDAIPDLAAQLGLYQQRLAGGGTVDLNGLYVLNFGGNDIFNAATAATARGTSVDQYLRDAASQYAAGVQTLNNLGARNILITGFPVADDANSLTAEGYLTTALGGLALDGDTDLFRFSYLDFFGRVQTDPGSLGLPPQVLPPPRGSGPTATNYTCQQAGAAAIANGCVGIFSFDGTHPTAPIHAALFREVDRQFALTAGVPEPATWVAMVLGFGLVGGALRRRPARVTVA